MISLGLGTVSTLGTAMQASQISSLSSRTDDKAEQTDLAAALSRITSLETSVAALTTAASGYASATGLANVCTFVSIIP